jgi:DNA-binding response OmpR family regulator
LIAERNPHVRKFLRRELAAEGYRVELASNGREVLRMLDSNKVPDLLILDLDIPHVSGLEILKQLQDRESPLPVVVHTFLSDYADYPAVQNAAAFVEKTGNNIDKLKAVILDVLAKAYPRRKCQHRLEPVKSKELDGANGRTVPS